MQLTSAAFQQESTIPSMSTCDGENISREISWRDAPAETGRGRRSIIKCLLSFDDMKPVLLSSRVSD